MYPIPSIKGRNLMHVESPSTGHLYQLMYLSKAKACTEVTIT